MKYLVLLLICLNVIADGGLTVVSVGDAEVVKESLLVEKIFSEGVFTPNEVEQSENYINIVRNDFKFYQNYFNVLPRRISQTSFDNVRFTNYKTKETNFLVRFKIVRTANQTSLSYKLWNIAAEQELISKSIPYDANNREAIHAVSDEIYRAIVGKPSIFKDKIVFVSDYKMPDGKKELFIMDFDGANPKRLTWHNGVVLSPAVSHDGSKIVYSLIDESIKGAKKNVNLMLYDVATKKSTILSKRKGLNSGAIFTNNGDEIILTLSHQGNAELYRMNLKTRAITRLTKSYAPDVDPSLSADGSILTFLSGRPGKPMIYTMDPNGLEKDVKRISYVGKYNATPRFHPSASEIVFSSWLDNRFDLFKVGSDGQNLHRLTKDFGSNEDPEYSKDGQFIIFTSLRVLSQSRATQSVYIMDTWGKILGPLTSNFGKCTSGRWLKSL
ncbi:TolB family protein [Halobacteriovorax sp. RZ-2]|uniref:TolB family protein n=1 Tax=unclassified Halobacteriovorax TaxID=2639665 RepID=UPI003719D027